jgi:hypothetical protein
MAAARVQITRPVVATSAPKNNAILPLAIPFRMAGITLSGTRPALAANAIVIRCKQSHTPRRKGITVIGTSAPQRTWASRNRKRTTTARESANAPITMAGKLRLAARYKTCS